MEERRRIEQQREARRQEAFAQARSLEQQKLETMIRKQEALEERKQQLKEERDFERAVKMEVRGLYPTCRVRRVTGVVLGVAGSVSFVLNGRRRLYPATCVCPKCS